MYDLTVAWRVYPKISRTPFIDFVSKYELVKVCLKSFINSTKDLKIKYFFILDGCPFEYNNLIHELFNQQDFVIIETPGIGNELTFKKQIEILLDQKYSEAIYFAEDDYLYQPEQFCKIVKFLKEKDVDFVSCYQHFDTFTNNIHLHSRDIKHAYDHFWHTDSSTCLTFITTKETLRKTKDIFLTYCNGNFDVCIWLTITGTFVRNPFNYFKYYFFDKNSFWILQTAFRKGLRFLFTSRKYKLWIPYPAIGTHIEKDFISPSVDWKEIAHSNY
jgi:hypothetical protein